MLSANVLTEFLDALRREVTGEVRADPYNRLLYSTDASIYQALPHGVLIPKTIEDVHAAVELAMKHGIPVLPRGGGSSLAGQGVNEALVIDMTRHLNQVISVNTEERWARVQPGLVLDQLNAFLRPMGLQFGPDPASSNRATMGGIVSNNSTGSHSICYGMTADHIQAMNVILSDGSATTFGPMTEAEVQQKWKNRGFEGDLYRSVALLVQDVKNQEIIRKHTPRHWRRCGGYNLDRLIQGATFHHAPDLRFNLAKLVCGAEGGFAVMTDLTVGLVPLPEHTGLAIIQFDRLYDALLAIPALLEMDPSAVELLDDLSLRMARGIPAYARMMETFLHGQPHCVLLTEFHADQPAELTAKIKRLRDHVKKQVHGAGIVTSVLEPERQATVWQVRKAGLGLLMSVKGDHKPIPFIEDAAVPVEHLAEYVTKVAQFCTEMNTTAAYYAHASAGCVHIRPLINTKRAEEIRKLPTISRFAVDLLKGYGGALSSEHGDGRARSWLNPHFFDPELYGLYQATKRAFDPKNLLNPGTVVDGPDMTANLRFGPSYQTRPWDTPLDFSAEQGIDRAIEMCNGAGVCRKHTTGTMCPSFMVTGEEEHSTRGRANLLRSALSGHLPPDALTDTRLYEAMDLCISCKACKTECPSSVDMAKLKFAFLAEYYTVHGIPRRAQFFGDVARFSRLSSGWRAGLVNRSMRNTWVRKIMAKRLRIHPERPLPAFAQQPFTKWFKKRKNKRQRGRGTVVLFNDTFNTYNTPDVAIAATEVLEALGYKVILPGHACCGRPMISKGLIESARKMAQDTIDRLAPLVERGFPVIGLEPSCLLSLQDEYRYLLPNDARVNPVAESAFTFEEFIAEVIAQDELNLDFTYDDREILLHGHCHQKALVGNAPSLNTLRALPNTTVTELDTSCCGMAGSFGYEIEHYDLSLQMAERRLLPAVRTADPDTLIVAAGTSCRHQIEDATGRLALHPAQVLRNALDL